LIYLQWYVLVLTLRLVVYTLFEKNKIKFGQKIFASPKICTPVHLCWRGLSCGCVFTAKYYPKQGKAPTKRGANGISGDRARCFPWRRILAIDVGSRRRTEAENVGCFGRISHQVSVS